MRVSYTPERGDVIWLDFDRSSGHEQTGKRPALVLSPRAYNSRSGLALVCPITSRAKGYPFEVPLPSSSVVAGVVLADHVRNIDWRARRARRATTAAPQVIEEVLGKTRALLT